jgi:pimeloyl-ACP methyl ester carboxylesterase
MAGAGACRSCRSLADPGRRHGSDRPDRFTEIVGFDRYAVYVFDYGAPTGFRLAVRHPDRITAIISQNGNAYEEGLSEGWNPIRAYWQDPSEANREALRSFLKPETTIWQYTHGVPDPTTVSPDGYSLDNPSRGGGCAARPVRRLQEQRRALPDLPDLFPDPQAAPAGSLGQERPVLPFVRRGGVQARHPDGVVRFFDTGHFALETHAAEIAAAIRDFLPR